LYLVDVARQRLVFCDIRFKLIPCLFLIFGCDFTPAGEINVEFFHGYQSSQNSILKKLKVEYDAPG
jgi:hypothetical protein